MNDFEATATAEEPENPGSVTDPQFDEAERLGMTWEHEGRKYPFFIANRTGNIGTTLYRDGDPIAIVQADFLWEQAEPFLDHLDFDLKDERNRDNETERHRANLVIKNAKLFDALVQRGSIIRIQDGERSEPIEQDRDQLLRLAPEVQSQIVDDWLGQFHVKRYFPKMMADDISMLLSEPDTLYFEAFIGSLKSPAHCLVFEFKTPSKDARRAYENDTFAAIDTSAGNKIITSYYINNEAKLRYAKKHLKAVDGAKIGLNGVLDIDTEQTYEINSDESLKEFKSFFNPHWMIRLADELNGAFNFSGK